MPILKEIKQHKLLLDTHVWIKIASGEIPLDPHFTKALDRSKDIDNVFISAISVWELGMLVEKKRIELEVDCLEWVERSLSKGLTLFPLTIRIAILSSRLPGNSHGDPADRILIATAHEEGAVLVTCDQKILEYGRDKFIQVFDPSL